MDQRDRVEKAIDQAIGRRVLSTCWLLAGLGSSVFQMLLFAQAWTLSQQAFVPACMASAWVLGAVFVKHIRAEARLWWISLALCVLLWLRDTQFTSGQIIQTFQPQTVLNLCTLAASAFLLGAISTSWLNQLRLWSPATERVTLARALVGTTLGLFVVWVLPAWAGLLGLTCVMPLLVFDFRFARRAPQPEETGVVEAWVGRYWRPDLRPLSLRTTSLPRNWCWSYLVGRAQESKGYLLLTLLASSAAVILGGVWAAVPTAFAGEMLETHELGKLGWLLGGQIVALVLGCWWLRASRAAVGFPDRLLPLPWHIRALHLALLMLVIMGGSLVALGLPFLQAPWWLAASIASYTLAAAAWGILLPRLRPSRGTVVFAQRHLLLGQGKELPDPLHVAYDCAQEERVMRLVATAEGVLIAVFSPVVGLLIDVCGSFDRVLVIVGLYFLLGLALLVPISIVRSLQQPQRLQLTRSTFRRLAALSWRPGECREKGGET